MRRVLLLLVACITLAGCTAEPIWAPDADVVAKRYVHGGPATLTLITVINNRSGSGGHTGLMINADERVIWDPAGTWWSPNSPERNDLHYGITDRLVDVYIDYHTRETYHTVTQEIAVSPQVAAMAKKLAAEYGAVPKAACSLSTSQILSQLPGFEFVGTSYFPNKIMDKFAKLPGVKTQKFYDDDPDDNSGKLPQG